MKEIIVHPQEGIGDLTLGMEKAEVDGLLKPSPWVKENFFAPKLSEVRYEQYHVTYREGRAVEIQILGRFMEDCQILLGELDLFRTAAEQVFAALRGLGPWDCDDEDTDMARTYSFAALDLRLWRERAYHPKLEKETWFQAYSPESREDERRFRYFDTALVHTPEMALPTMEKCSMYLPGGGISSPQSDRKPTAEELEAITQRYGLEPK